MARTPKPVIPAEDPPELITFVVQEAERDADDVEALLAALGMRRTDTQPLLLPASFLLGLGAALQLLRWEAQGFTPHLAAGLLPALEAIKALIRSFTNVSTATRDLQIVAFSLSVFRIAITSFAWEGQAILGADVLLGEPDEDALVEAFAQLVWQMRHEVSKHGCTPSHN